MRVASEPPPVSPTSSPRIPSRVAAPPPSLPVQMEVADDPYDFPRDRDYLTEIFDTNVPVYAIIRWCSACYSANSFESSCASCSSSDAFAHPATLGTYVFFCFQKWEA